MILETPDNIIYPKRKEDHSMDYLSKKGSNFLRLVAPIYLSYG